MADGKTGRKRRVVIEAETPITDVPGQGELFGRIPTKTLTETTAAPDPSEPEAAVLPPDLLSAGQDLLSTAKATPQKR
ncbi:MAG: tyrosine-type recombinase/integrase, partial [Thermoplasmata archaeon]